MPLLILRSVTGFLAGLYYFPVSVTNWITQEWQQADLSMKTIKIEEAKESFGSLIVSLFTGVADYTGWRKNMIQVRSEDLTTN